MSIAHIDCTDDGAVWWFSGDLGSGKSIEVRLVAETNSSLHEGDCVDHSVYGASRFDDEGGCVENTACVFAGVADSGLVGIGDPIMRVLPPRLDCSTETVEVHRRHERLEPTATPTAQPTATPQTPIVIIVQPTPVPTAAPLPKLAGPPTGTGSESGGTSCALPIGLGLGGMCLLVVSGAAVARKRIR